MSIEYIDKYYIIIKSDFIYDSKYILIWKLWVKSVVWKIEKCVLERIGHVVRMKNDRYTKFTAFGWIENIECQQKIKGIGSVSSKKQMSNGKTLKG